MENTEEEEGFEPIMEEIVKSKLILYTQSGSYIIIPDVNKFITDNDGEALMVSEDDYIYVLKKGLKKNSMQWVCLNEGFE